MIRPNGAVNNMNVTSRAIHYHTVSMDTKAIRHNQHNRIREITERLC